MRPRALVIGGSVGGLFAANLLLRTGWDAVVFERSTGSLSDRGAGIGTRDELFAVLRLAGVQLEANSTVDVRGRLALDRHGVLVHQLPLRSVSSAWAHVYRPLRAAFPSERYYGGRTVAVIEQDSNSVTAVFADGTRVRGDLLIGADGLHSTVRRQFLPEAEALYAGYVSWRGVVDQTEVPDALRETIFDRLMFCFPDEGMLLTTPAGNRSCQFVWYRSVPADAVPLLCTDAHGRQYGWSIPPTFIRPQLVHELHASARVMLPSALAGLVCRVAQPRLQPIFDLESPSMVFGRVVLLGDAAFVARPHVASGVTKAALDAQGLADALRETADIHAALARYERERKVFGRRLVARGRHLGAWIAASRNQIPIATVLSEYGATGFVDSESIAALTGFVDGPLARRQAAGPRP